MKGANVADVGAGLLNGGVHAIVLQYNATPLHVG